MTNIAKTLAAGVLLALSLTAAADEPFPSKPIRVVIPFAPGGVVDIMMRIIGPELSAQLGGQPIVVDNRPGGGAQIAASAMTSSPADGYTLFAAGMGAFAINPTLYKKINYQPVTDFEGVSFLASAPMVMLASPGGRVSSTKALKDALNAGASLTYATPGPGTAPHILGHLLSRASPKAPLVHVPYKGMPPATQALMTGEIDLLFDAVPGTLGLVKAQKAVPLALAAGKRSEHLPQVPTAAEIGYPDMAMDMWIGVAAKKGTPAAIVKRLHAAFESAMTKPELWKKFAELGYSRSPMTTPQFNAFIKSELERYRPVILEAGVTVD